MSHIRSAERFSNRIDNYVRYRPGYPKAILERLKDECGLTDNSVIADLGSGTGKLAEIFLENGNTVFGVEPNGGMRAAAEVILSRFRQFRNMDAAAESTSLEDSSIDFVVAGQAFHWFDPVETKRECIRILKPNGWAVLIWNERQVDSTPFLRAYEQLLLTYGTDYQEVRHENAEPAVETFFAPRVPNVMQFPNRQDFDFEALKGRLLSSSYTPEETDPRFEPMLDRLAAIFTEYQQNRLVVFEYDTRVFYGQLKTFSEPPLMSNERRSKQRITTSLPARWEGMIDTEEPRIDDISLGGCFVNTRAHVQLNETIDLEVRFPSGEWLPLRGSVISYQPGVGFGLSFTSLSDREISALQRLT